MSILTSTYSGEMNQAQSDSLTRLKLNQFTSVLAWAILSKVGSDANGTYYVLRKHTNKPENLVADAIEFANAVTEGTAIQLAGTSSTTTSA